MLLSIGSDFEMPISLGGVIRSVEGLIGGTKDRPLWVDESLGNLQEDNVMAEGAIVACYSKDEFMDKMSGLTTYLHNYMSERGYKIVASCSEEYTREEVSTLQGRTMGCDRDWDAYIMRENDRPNGRTTRRSAGGHVHVGVEIDERDVFNVVQAMDAFVAVPLMLILNGEQKNKEVERRVLYGRAGSFRFKPYGFEYRTLSNLWTFDPRLIEFVYDATAQAVLFATSGGTNDPDKVVGVINRGEPADLNYFHSSLSGWSEV